MSAKKIYYLSRPYISTGIRSNPNDPYNATVYEFIVRNQVLLSQYDRGTKVKSESVILPDQNLAFSFESMMPIEKARILYRHLASRRFVPVDASQFISIPFTHHKLESFLD